MNIGKTAALVTATAGAVVFGGGHALADPVQQSNACDSRTGAALSGTAPEVNCLNFAHIFGDLKSVTQQNHCDSSGASSAANVVIVPIQSDQQCANIAIGNPSTTAAGAR